MRRAASGGERPRGCAAPAAAARVGAAGARARHADLTRLSRAQWCGPCRKFTPLLSVCYEDMPSKDEVEVRRPPRCAPRAACPAGPRRFQRRPPAALPAQVVFVSADHDSEGFDEYFAEMPWAAVPFAADQRESAPEAFDVQGIPRVVVLKAADGSVVNADARGLITDKKKLVGIF